MTNKQYADYCVEKEESFNTSVFKIRKELEANENLLKQIKQHVNDSEELLRASEGAKDSKVSFSSKEHAFNIDLDGDIMQLALLKLILSLVEGKVKCVEEFIKKRNR